MTINWTFYPTSCHPHDITVLEHTQCLTVIKANYSNYFIITDWAEMTWMWTTNLIDYVIQSSTSVFFKIIRKTSRNDQKLFGQKSQTYQQGFDRFSGYFVQFAGKLWTYQVMLKRSLINQNLCKIFLANFLVYPANLSIKVFLVPKSKLLWASSCHTRFLFKFYAYIDWGIELSTFYLKLLPGHNSTNFCRVVGHVNWYNEWPWL